jgi:hypothetical protein
VKGWVKPHNGPYGSPRGNAVMKAKRVTGESAHETLRIHVLHERCEARGCQNPVLVTRHPDMNTRHRRCADHVAGLPARKGKRLKF